LNPWPEQVEIPWLRLILGDVQIASMATAHDLPNEQFEIIRATFPDAKVVRLMD
jgi:hypothetical protein